MFYFNDEKFEFWEIYESIKKYYPIGINKNDDSKMFYSYPGFKALALILTDKIHDDNNFKTIWANHDRIIESELQKPVIGTTLGQAPSFSSYVELEKLTVDNFTRTKELHYFVSIFGPYYTIIGQDKNAVKIDAKIYGSTNYLVVSPEKEFAEAFNFMTNNIESRFQDYRFVPFHICKQTINGLDVRYQNDNLNAIFHALFTRTIDLNINALGDDYYKSEDWIKESYIDDGSRWMAYPPNHKF